MTTNTAHPIFPDEANPTPCMLAFREWWEKNRSNFEGIGSYTAWRIFMHGYWAGEAND